LLAQQAGCPVLVVDHYGKDEERGLIGSAAKEAAAHFVLGSGGERESRTDRQLEVKKMKDGPAYICVDFDLDTYDVILSKQDTQEQAKNRRQRAHGSPFGPFVVSRPFDVVIPRPWVANC
jgi:hypothetical protein